MHVAEGPLDERKGVAKGTEGTVAGCAEQSTDRAAITRLPQVVMVDDGSQTRDSPCSTHRAVRAQRGSDSRKVVSVLKQLTLSFFTVEAGRAREPCSWL